MKSINGGTTVQMTMTQVFLVVGAILGGAYYLHQDNASIRTTLDKTNERNHSTLQKSITDDDELRKELSSLTEELRKATTAFTGTSQRIAVLSASFEKSMSGLSSGMTELSGSVRDLDDTVGTINTRLDRSIERQKAFERAVLFQLGVTQDGQKNFVIPEGWDEAQDVLYRNVLERGNPVSTWLAITGEEQ